MKNMELWEIYDINRKKLGRVIDRHSAGKLKDGEYHLVVEAIIINSKGEILVSKRAPLKQMYPLTWECTGGSCIKGETSLQSILREIREELGLNFQETEAIFYKTLRDDEAKDFKDIWLFKKDIEIKSLKYTDGEVVDSKWVTIEEFETMCAHKEIVPTVDFTKEDYKKCLDLGKAKNAK